MYLRHHPHPDHHHHHHHHHQPPPLPQQHNSHLIMPLLYLLIGFIITIGGACVLAHAHTHGHWPVGPQLSRTRTRTHACTRTHTHTRTHAHTHTHTRMHACTHARTRTHTIHARVHLPGGPALNSDMLDLMFARSEGQRSDMLARSCMRSRAHTPCRKVVTGVTNAAAPRLVAAWRFWRSSFD